MEKTPNGKTMEHMKEVEKKKQQCEKEETAAMVKWKQAATEKHRTYQQHTITKKQRKII